MNGDSNDFVNEHRGKIAGGLIGLILALLFVIFGFWKAFFIITFVLAGAFIGSRAELRKEIQLLLNRIWHGRER
ncbi:MAG: DUF2273 domain-containing protein [Bacillota bacterium]